VIALAITCTPHARVVWVLARARPHFHRELSTGGRLKCRFALATPASSLNADGYWRCPELCEVEPEPALASFWLFLVISEMAKTPLGLKVMTVGSPFLSLACTTKESEMTRMSVNPALSRSFVSLLIVRRL
jgi:hypothetical protein